MGFIISPFFLFYTALIIYNSFYFYFYLFLEKKNLFTRLFVEFIKPGCVADFEKQKNHQGIM